MGESIDDPRQDRWVFAYGSLLWNPGFAFQESQRATLRGYHRSLCIFSHVHRGTADRPGLVFGLDRGGACVGLAYRVSGRDWPSVIDYLRDREQVTAIYREAEASIRLQDGRSVQAVSFVVDRNHAQYAGKLELATVERLVRQGVGISGDNVAYVLNTHAHLIQLGITDAPLASLSRALAHSSSDASASTAASEGS
jgi:cation transport protein ChaC